MEPDDVKKFREEQARRSIAIGHIKLLSSASHYAFCVAASLRGNYSAKGSIAVVALEEIDAALAHLAEAAHIVAALGEVQE